jgi:hypothetical protein
VRTAKQEALEKIQSLPDEASLSEILESLRVVFQNRAEGKGPFFKSGMKEARSCHDLLEDLLGSVEAERDLSTNKSYLGDYGTIVRS